jgi:wobble nucleotide-excising tRNase
VDQNVYSGAAIDADHRKNLHSFALGEDGVKLAKAVDDLAVAIAKTNSELSASGDAIKNKYVQDGTTVEQFIDLDELEEADAIIEQRGKYVEALKQSQVVTALSLPQLFSLGAKIELNQVTALLSKSVDSISKETAELVRNHVAHHAPNEKWIQEALSSKEKHDCPFCGQDTQGVKLVDAYGVYFGETYKKHKVEIDDSIAVISKELSSESATKIANRFLTNAAILERWSKYIKVEQPSLNTEHISEAYSALSKALAPMLVAKANAPLDTKELDGKTDALFKQYEKALSEVEAYENTIREVIVGIESFKTKLEGGNLKEAQSELNDAQNRKLRFSKETKSLCAEYKKIKKKRAGLVEEKEEAKKKLDDFTESLLGKYQDSINDYIVRCGGNFKICDMENTYTGGKPRVEYKIKVFDESIDLTGKHTDMIGFKTAMSQGDKNTLAFSFFLAKLEQEKNIEKKTIVFDDPLSSLDTNRRQFTRSQVIRIAEKCEQIIILTHDEETAARFAREAPKKTLPESDRVFLELRAAGKYTEFHPLDIGILAKLPYLERWEVLNAFAEKGANPSQYQSISQAIRPMLEDNLKFRYPDEIRSDSTLGKIIGQIRDSSTTQQIHHLKSTLQSLEQIDAYVVKHSHGDETNCISENIAGSELLVHVKSALEFSRGLIRKATGAS